MIKYGYFNNETFVIVEYSGKISKEQIIDFIQFSTRDGKRRKVLSDLRNAILDFTEDEAEEIGQVWSRLINEPLQSVLIVNDARTTAMSMWFGKYLDSRFINTMVYSTLQPSISFLSLDISKNELENQIRGLTYTFP